MRSISYFQMVQTYVSVLKKTGRDGSADNCFGQSKKKKKKTQKITLKHLDQITALSYLNISLK